MYSVELVKIVFKITNKKYVWGMDESVMGELVFKLIVGILFN